jgi:probable F420-dependent oxidoreductase
MNFGITLPNYGPDASPEDMVRTAQTADSLGFDSAWTTDHILLPEGDSVYLSRLYEALITLGWIASQTRKIKLGVSSLVLPQRNPVTVAKQVAALDALSGGRTILCVGVGWSAGEYANLGQTFNNRGRRMEEALQVLRLLWSSTGSEPLSYQGQYYSFENGIFDPPPLQKGGPPLWIGGHSEAAVRRAAIHADGWHATGALPEQIHQSSELIQQLTKDHHVTISSRMRLSFDSADPTAPLKGSTQEVIDSLAVYREAGLEYPVINFQVGDVEERLEAMRRFVEDIIPAFQEAKQ